VEGSQGTNLLRKLTNPLGYTNVILSHSDQNTLIIVQRDATQSSLFIILQISTTNFAFQPHTSSGIHKTVTRASGTGHIFCGHVGGR